MYSVRKELFWIIDFFKGSKIKNHYEEIKKSHENMSSFGFEGRQVHIENLIKHSVDTVPFYKDFMNEKKLQNFPVINKVIVRKNFDLFKSSLYLNKKNYQVMTSGSTGNPFKIYQDVNKKARNTADTIFFGEKTGFTIGSRLYYFRLWDKQYKKNRLTSQMQNLRMYSVDNFGEDVIQALLEDFCGNKNPKAFLGYSSALEVICKYLDRKKYHPIDCNLTSVISIAEPLNDYIKKAIKKYFNVEAISRYSNSENGIIAQQLIDSKSDYFEINWSSYHVEILDIHSDTPVKKGEMGRIVITDLFNYCMPLIRYDTGDVGILNDNPLGDKKPMVFTKIEGRKMDLFTDTKGRRVSSHIVHKILQYDGIDQFQFVQEDAYNYTIKLKLFKEYVFLSSAKIIQEYKDYLGQDAQITIEFVENIPRLSSGKRKLVLNKYLTEFNYSTK